MQRFNDHALVCLYSLGITGCFVLFFSLDELNKFESNVTEELERFHLYCYLTLNRAEDRDSRASGGHVERVCQEEVAEEDQN